MTRIAGRSSSTGTGPPHCSAIRDVRLEPLERDLVAVEEAPQVSAPGVQLVSEHRSARGRRLGRDSLQPTRPADPLARQPPDLLCDVRRERCDRVVIRRLDPHDPGRLGSAKPDREQRPKRDRNLAEDVAGTSLADDAVDSIDELYRLNSAVEHREQRPLLALVRCVFARHQN